MNQDLVWYGLPVFGPIAFLVRVSGLVRSPGDRSGSSIQRAAASASMLHLLCGAKDTGAAFVVCRVQAIDGAMQHNDLRVESRQGRPLARSALGSRSYFDHERV